MDKKEARRQEWYNRVRGIDQRLYPDRSAYDVAKEQSKLEREANKLLAVGKKWKNGNYHVSWKKKPKV